MDVPPAQHMPKTSIAEVIGCQRDDGGFDAN